MDEDGNCLTGGKVFQVFKCLDGRECAGHKEGVQEDWVMTKIDGDVWSEDLLRACLREKSREPKIFVVTCMEPKGVDCGGC